MNVNTKNECQSGKTEVCPSSCKRFVIGTSINSRTFLADRKKGKLLFDTEFKNYGEYPLVRALLLLVFGMLGFLLFINSFKKGLECKKILKLREKEIKKLRKSISKGDKNNAAH